MTRTTRTTNKKKSLWTSPCSPPPPPQRRQQQQQRDSFGTSGHLFGARVRCSSLDLLDPLLSPNKVDPNHHNSNNHDDSNATKAFRNRRKGSSYDNNNNNNNNTLESEEDDNDDEYKSTTHFITKQLPSILASYREENGDHDETGSSRPHPFVPTFRPPASPAWVRSDAPLVTTTFPVTAPATTATTTTTTTTTNPSHDKSIDNNNNNNDKWIMLGLLWCICCLSALDRVAMSLALIPLSTEYDLTDAVKGSISSLFSVGYGVAILPAGLLVGGERNSEHDYNNNNNSKNSSTTTTTATRWSPKIVMAAGLAVWSLATLATPFTVGTNPSIDHNNDHNPTTTTTTTTFFALLLARAAVGAGESVILPSLQRFLVAWTTALEKSTALALLFSGFHAGTIAAYIVSPWLMEWHWGGGYDDDGGGGVEAVMGWRGLFVTYGLVGLGLLVPWMLWAKDEPEKESEPTKSITFNQESAATAPLVPSRNESNRHSNNQLVLACNEAYGTLQAVPWQQFAQSKGTWAMVLAHCAKNWGLYNALAWTPTFFAESYDIGVRDSALLSVLPSITGAVGGIVAGTTADSFLRNQLNEMEQNGKHSEEIMTLIRTRVRKAFQSMAFLGPAVAFAALAWQIPEQPWVAQTLLMAAVGLQSFGAAGYEAGIQEKAGERWAGLMYSITSLPAVMVGTAGVYITGQVLDFTHQDWSYVYGLNAAVNVLGTLAFVSMYNSKREFD